MIRLKTILPIVLLLVIMLNVVYCATVYVKVLDENGNVVSDVLVEAWQGLEKVSSGTTNASGIATLDVDTSKNVTFIASLGSGKYVIDTFVAPLTTGATYVLNASALYKVFVATNTTYSIPVEFEVPDYGTVKTSFSTNYTMYVDGVIKLVFPNETSVELFKKLVFVELKYDGMVSNSSILETTVTAPMNVTACYKIYAAIPLPTWLLVLIIACVIVLTTLIIVVGRAGKKTLETRRKRYIK